MIMFDGYPMKAISVDAIQYIEKQLRAYNLPLSELPPHIRKKVLREGENIALGHVFGVDAKRGKDGMPIQRGLGSKAQPTLQSVMAYEKYCTHETNFVENLAKMKSDLAAYEARKAKERAEAEAIEEARELEDAAE